MLSRGQVNASWIRYFHLRSDAVHLVSITCRSIYLTQCKPRPPGAVCLPRSAQSREASLQQVKSRSLAFRPVEVQIKKVSTRESCRLLRDYLQLISGLFGERLMLWVLRYRCESARGDVRNLYLLLVSIATSRRSAARNWWDEIGQI